MAGIIATRLPLQEFAGCYTSAHDVSDSKRKIPVRDYRCMHWHRCKWRSLLLKHTPTAQDAGLPGFVVYSGTRRLAQRARDA
jgi:hypothetical protein